MSENDVYSFNYRKDNRTDEEFAKAIKENTEKERIAAEIFAIDLVEHGKKKVSYKDNGMGNDGKVVKDFKKVSADPDYSFLIDDEEILMEFKVHSERFKCYTFKESNLRTYLLKKSMIIIPRETFWLSIRPEAIRHILENYPIRSYDRFAGGKPAIRIDASDVEDISRMRTNDGKPYMMKVGWSDKAQKLIDEKKVKLFGEAKK